jgi:hypothetical protein
MAPTISATSASPGNSAGLQLLSRLFISNRGSKSVILCKNYKKITLRKSGIYMDLERQTGHVPRIKRGLQNLHRRFESARRLGEAGFDLNPWIPRDLSFSHPEQISKTS